MESSQDCALATDPEVNGFDLSAGKTWIYPENYPIRDYQLNIVNAALYNNTLVCLPTGLGKTFIAAVVMYNFWRWYPRGKVIFLAPTKPLVSQQIDACYNVMGIPDTDSIELTGTVTQKARQTAWVTKRIIFATPQVFYNDLEKDIIPNELIKCVVIDEAHKALGKYAYCECIRILSEKNKYFRILALSATPGNKIASVHDIIKNLHISHIELRDETSPDIVPYINERKLDIILVPLGNELSKFKDRYITIMDRHVKYLIQLKALHGNTANITKGKIFMVLKEFQRNANKSGNYGNIVKTLNILLIMYHAYELMVRHGLRAFHKFYQNHSDKFWMNSEPQLQELLDEIEKYLGPFPDIQSFSGFNSDILDIPDNLVFGHNKFVKLKELLVQHFRTASENNVDTRAIIFVEYRDSVNEVYILLLQARPLIRAQMFMGQSGQKQKQQMKAIEDFRQNRVNVLISTSIGEEGLDVGEVDLIICFDISQKSPIRLVQRMGRTGRKRSGHIIALVTDGKERETLMSTMAKRDSLNNKILNTDDIKTSLYENNPRMIPDKYTPVCRKMFINVEIQAPMKKNRKSKKKQTAEKQTNESMTKKTRSAKQSNNLNELKDTNQPLMAKFLTTATNKFASEGNSDFLVPNVIKNDNEIKISDVKLLSCDNEAIEFLTLCAMKKSEQEMNLKPIKRIGTNYILRPEPLTNFFNFIIPDTKILDCISNLNDVIEINQRLNDVDQPLDIEYSLDAVISPCFNNIEQMNIAEPRIKDLLNDNIEQWDFIEPRFEDLPNHNANKQMNITESKFKNLLDDDNIDEQIDIAEPKFKDVLDSDVKQVNTTESRFEDLLDESSESNETPIESCKKYVDPLKDTTKATLLEQENSNAKDSGTNTATALSTEPSLFEDIFNDSFEFSDTDEYTHNSKKPKLESPNITTLEKENIQCERKLLTSPLKTVMSNLTSVNVLKEQNTENKFYYEKEKKDDMSILFPKRYDDLYKNRCTKTKIVEEADKKSVTKMDKSSTFSDTKSSTESLSEANTTNSHTLSHTLSRIINDLQAGNYESEDDMFAEDFDDDFEVKSINNEPLKEEKLNEAKGTKGDISEMRKEHSTACNSWNNNIKEMKEWNDDFEISSTSFANTKYVPHTSSPHISKSSVTTKSFFTENIKSDDSDSSEWISFNKSKQENTSMPLTKKLSKKRDSQPTFVPPKDIISNNFDVYENDLIINAEDIQKLNDLESNYFIECKEKHKSKEEGHNISTTRDFDSFKVSNKYLNNYKSVDKNTKTINSSNLGTYTKKKLMKPKNKRKMRCKYINNEAEASHIDVSDDESSDADEDLSDFVSYTQHLDEAIDMKPVYLQATKSPVKQPGAFVFKKPQSPKEVIEIYSQSFSPTEETYLQDSFCVDGDDLDETKNTHGYTILEEAEKLLEKKKRKRTSFDRSEGYSWKKKRKKRCEVLDTSSSSEDEVEKIRREVQEESIIFKDLRL